MPSMDEKLGMHLASLLHFCMQAASLTASLLTSSSRLHGHFQLRHYFGASVQPRVERFEGSAGVTSMGHFQVGPDKLPRRSEVSTPGLAVHQFHMSTCNSSRA